MKAPKQMQKPENWQDFETLCKKLRWEIRKCPEIKKNWRSWQKQYGVDVYWVPKCENGYYWIQCKGKDEYVHAQLTKEEVDLELKKAMEFAPKLQKLYFATTANKDVNIEEYVRKKDLENRAKWLFEVHIFSREDIVDLIEENKNTYNFYMKSIDFKSHYNAEVTFNDFSVNKTEEVPFLKTKKQYKYIERSQAEQQQIKLNKMIQKTVSWAWMWMNKEVLENYSLIEIRLTLSNTWSEQLDNCKIYLDFKWEIENISGRWVNYMIPIKDQNIDTRINDEDKSWKLEKPKKNYLLPWDTYTFDQIYILPKSDGWEIVIHRELLSTQLKLNWELTVQVEGKLAEHEEIIEVDTKDEEKVETVVENFILTNELKKKFDISLDN